MKLTWFKRLAVKKLYTTIETFISPRRQPVWLLLFFIFSPLTAMADSSVDYLSKRSLEDLMTIPVNSIGFYEVPVNQAPGSIWILNEELLETIPGVTLKDMLQLAVPGVQVSGNSLLGSLYTTRGSPMRDNSTTLFMWDGMNINSAGSLGINASLKSSLLGDIAKLEVSNGPSSLLHGNGAINGFVNQVPKSGESHPGAWVNTMVGVTESLVKTEASYGHVYGVGRDFYLYAGGERASGFQPGNDLGYSDFNPGNIPDDFYVRTKDKLNYRMSVNWNHDNIRMVGFIQKEWLSSDNYLSSRTSSPNIYYQTLALRPSVTLPLTPTENLSVNLPVVLFDNGYIFDLNSLGQTRRIDHGNSDMRVETNWVLRSLRWENQQWAAGFRFSQDKHRNNQYYFRTDPPPTPIGEDIDWREFSFFTEDIIDIVPGWTVTAGLRFNAIRYQLDGNDSSLKDVVVDSEKWFPRIATAIRVGEDTTVKLSYQEGFHYPSATALYSSNLNPEYVDSYEINLLHTLPERGLSFTANGFFNVYKNALVSGTKSHSGDQNRDFGSFGGEFLVDWKGPDSLRAMVSYAYTRPHDLGDDNVVVETANEDLTKWLSYPSHSIKAMISRRWLNDTLMTSLAGEYGSRVERNELDWYKSRDLFHTDRFSVSFKANYALSDHLGLDFIVNNVLDNNIPVPNTDYLNPWEGTLGDTETRFYIGLTWQ